MLSFENTKRLNTVMFKCCSLIICISSAQDVFSSPEPKAQLSFSDQNLSVVRGCPWCCR